MAIHGNCIDKEEKKAEHRNWYLRVPNQKISRCKSETLARKTNKQTITKWKLIDIDQNGMESNFKPGKRTYFKNWEREKNFC